MTMYKTRIRRLYPGGAIDWSGKKLSFIGNLPVQEGDEVWTDGLCIYGNEHVRGESFIPSPDLVGIPVIAVKDDEGFMGFIMKNGKKKKCDIIDDDWIINTEEEYYHGKDYIDRENLEGRYVDVEIAKDEDGNPIGLYKATYDSAWPGVANPVKIYLNDMLVETVDLTQFTSGWPRVDKFKINSDGSWQLIGNETNTDRIYHQSEYDVTSTPGPVFVGEPGDVTFDAWGDYVATTIVNPDSDPEKYFDGEDDGFPDIDGSRACQVYSKEATKLNSWYLEPEQHPLETDTEVGQVILERLKRFCTSFPDEAAALVSYYNSQNGASYTTFWELIRDWMCEKFLRESRACPSCRKTGYLSYDTSTYTDFITNDTPGNMHCSNCGYTGPLKLYFYGYWFWVAFQKDDMSKIERDQRQTTPSQRHENFKMFTYDSKTSTKKVWLETDITEDNYWWATYQLMDYQDMNHGTNSYICSDTGFVTCYFPKLNASSTGGNPYYYFADARLRFWHHYYGPTQYAYGHTQIDASFADFKWPLNDGYVAYMNVFQVHRIVDKEGKQICGELPVQKTVTASGYVKEPVVRIRSSNTFLGFSEISAEGAKNWNGDGPYSGYSSITYGGTSSFPSACSLFVKKLMNGYLIGFRGCKTYYVDKEQRITEIGDNTKNFRMNYLKAVSKAKE